MLEKSLIIWLFIGYLYDRTFSISENLQISITISIGGEIANDNSSTPQDLLHQADLALYQAKQNGRNCLRFSPDAELLIQ